MTNCPVCAYPFITQLNNPFYFYCRNCKRYMKLAGVSNSEIEELSKEGAK